MPKRLEHPEWFDAKAPPQHGADTRQDYEGLVSQRRYSDIEVPDALWKCTVFGAGKPFAGDQVEDMARETRSMKAFDDWVAAFAAHVEKKGIGTGHKGSGTLRRHHHQPGPQEDRLTGTSQVPATERVWKRYVSTPDLPGDSPDHARNPHPQIRGS